MTAATARPITGRHVLLGLIGFFAIVIAANAAFIFLALDSWTGLSRTDAYNSGLAYNQTLDAGARQRALGWQPEIRHHDLGDGRGQLSLFMRDADGAPINGLTVEATVRRPAEDEFDQAVVLAPLRAGEYQAEIHLPLAGQWDIAITATRAPDTVFRIEDRLWLR